MNNNDKELQDIKSILTKYNQKIKNDEKKLHEMNKYIEEIQKYLAKQKKQLREIYSFVDNYGIVMKKQDDAGITPTLDEYLSLFLYIHLQSSSNTLLFWLKEEPEKYIIFSKLRSMILSIYLLSLKFIGKSSNITIS